MSLIIKNTYGSSHHLQRVVTLTAERIFSLSWPKNAGNPLGYTIQPIPLVAKVLVQGDLAWNPDSSSYLVLASALGDLANAPEIGFAVAANNGTGREPNSDSLCL